MKIIQHPFKKQGICKGCSNKVTIDTRVKLCNPCHALKVRAYRAKFPARVKAAKKRANFKLRTQILEFYSLGDVKCNCCGEREVKFLALDHIHNDGNIQRKQTHGASGTSLYTLIKRLNFPPGFQILCHNCNLAKGFYGLCPHKGALNGN